MVLTFSNLSLVVHLITKSSSATFKLLRILLDAADPVASAGKAKTMLWTDFCKALMTKYQKVQTKPARRTFSTKCFLSFADETKTIHPKVSSTCHQILVILKMVFGGEYFENHVLQFFSHRLVVVLFQDKLLIDLQKAVHKSARMHAELPILQTLQYHIADLCKLLIQGSAKRYSSSSNLK